LGPLTEFLAKMRRPGEKLKADSESVTSKLPESGDRTHASESVFPSVIIEQNVLF